MAQADRLRDGERVAKAETLQETSAGSHLQAFARAASSLGNAMSFSGGRRGQAHAALPFKTQLSPAKEQTHSSLGNLFVLFKMFAVQKKIFNRNTVLSVCIH